MLQIAVINDSTAISDAEIHKMLPAFDQQWNNDLEKVWGVTSASFQFLNRGQAPDAGSWWLVFLDNSDDPRALAYHDLTTEGLPLSKIFVKTILADNASVSVGATNEVCEMAVDPWLDSAYQDPDGVFWAGEICDPVEDDQYGYLINGTLVTDFVTPDWFAHKNAKGVIDFKGHADTAFQVLTGGYAQKFDPESGWVQVNGKQIKASRRLNPGVGSRRERRARSRRRWQVAEVKFGREAAH